MASKLPAWLWPERLGRLDLEAAFRASFCGVVPLALLVAFDRAELIVYAAFAALTSIYGRGECYRDRARTLAVAGTTMVLVIALGMCASLLALAAWQVTACLALLAVLGVLMSERMQWVPYGATFFVFAFAVVSSVPVEAGEMPSRLLLAASTVVLCWGVGMAGMQLRRPAALQIGARVRLPAPRELHTVERRPGAWSDPVVWWTALEAALGVVLAIAIATALGFGHAYWAAVAVVACMPRPYSRRFLVKTGHRIIGTGFGVLVAGAVLGLHPPVWVLVVAVGVFQFVTELIVGRVYWLATVFITPLALVVGYLAQASALTPMLVDRLADTLIGGTVLLVVELAGRRIALRLVQARTAATAED